MNVDREILDHELASRIVDIVCEACEISRSDIHMQGRCRRDVSTARMLIAYFIERDTRFTPREIVRYIGYPAIHRTTGYHYLRDKRKGRKTLYEERSPFQKKLRLLKDQIEEALHL